MADLHDFDANKVEPRAAMDPIPAGKYLAMLNSSEMKANKSGTGQFLELVFTIVEGEYKNRQLWARLNLVNPNELAVKIAQAELSALCRAVNVLTPRDSCELHGLAMIFTNATAKVKTLWAEMIGWMEKKWNAFKISGFTETLAGWLAPIFAKIQGVGVEETQKALEEDFARGRSAKPQTEAAIDAATKAKTDEIEKERKATEEELAKDKLRADQQRQGRIDAAQSDVDAARRELDDAVQKARKARDRAAAGGSELPGKSASKPAPDFENLAAAKTSIVGTFSGEALRGLGTGSTIEEKMEKHLAKIAEGTDRQNVALERLQRNMNQGLLLA